MSAERDVVHTFWYGSELPPLARACLGSFVARRHTLHVHAYERLELPDGAHWRDANEVMSRDELIGHETEPGAITSFADVFRYELLHRHGGWWVDTDVYCLTDELPRGERFWAEQEPGVLNNAILKFPPGDPLCARLASLARERTKRDMSWGELGPSLVTEVLSGSDGVDPKVHGPRFYPIHWIEAHTLWLPECGDEVHRRTSDALFLHCWAQALGNMGIDARRRPPRGSYLARMMEPVHAGQSTTSWQRQRTRRSIDRYLRQPWVRQYWEQKVGRDWHSLAGAPRGPALPPSSSLAKQIVSRWPALRYSVAFPLRARRRGARIPPGWLGHLQERIDSDPRFFLERSRALGPVFKVILNGNYTTCVLGHERGARLIGMHEDKLPGVTVDLAPLFPIGALRGMSGDIHRRYRRLFLHAIQATPFAVHRDALESVVRERLRELASEDRPITGPELRNRLRSLTTEIMLRLIYGLTPESPEYATLEASYRRFGPEAPATKLGDEQLDAFAEIRRVFTARARELSNGAAATAPPCFLGHLVRSGEVDATALGNLAYLFEPSHFDLYSLWHWMLKLLGGRADLHAAYRSRTGEEQRRYAEAVVLETLRMEQSELLYRRVTADVVFDGYLLPRDTLLRVLIWEGHKDENVFPNPFAFEPERFLAGK